MTMDDFTTEKRFRILVDGKLIPADLLTWGKWFEDIDNRRIGYEEFKDGYVSTVCMGTDLNLFGDLPLWFETMIFGGKHDQYQERYATLNEAIEGHTRAVEIAKG